jgi:hypothetical protein
MVTVCTNPCNIQEPYIFCPSMFAICRVNSNYFTKYHLHVDTCKVHIFFCEVGSTFYNTILINCKIHTVSRRVLQQQLVKALDPGIAATYMHLQVSIRWFGDTIGALAEKPYSYGNFVSLLYQDISFCAPLPFSLLIFPTPQTSQRETFLFRSR